MSLLIQDYLRSNSPEKLKEVYKIDYKIHRDYPELYLFKYNMIEADWSHQVNWEARSLILNKSKDWEIVCFPYTKFWELESSLVAKVDWSTARLLEKEDGSNMNLFHYDGKWNVSSSGMPDAAGMVGSLSQSFRDLYWATWNKLKYSLPSEEDKDYTFMTEYCSSLNRVVCEYDVSRIVLHGVRNCITGIEMAPESFAIKYGWECIKSHPIESLDVATILKMANGRDPFKHEGFVVVDANWNRAKCKSDSYKFWAHVRDGMGIRRMLDIIRNNQSDTFLEHWKEWQPLYNEVNSKYQELVTYLEEAWNSLPANPVSRKEWALLAIKYRHAPCLFSLLDKKVSSVKEYLAKINIKSLQESLGLKDIKFEVE